jgi:hypothetical protein
LCVFGSDLDNMKGSTVDAMSDAVDNAEVMLSCISLAYKESASKLRARAAVVRARFSHLHGHVSYLMHTVPCVCG